MSDNKENGAFSGLGILGAKQHFANQIDGIYGTFATPAGRVCYLQTKAKLISDGSNHSQLTKALVPAREALNIQEMDFNQLLQRDLDDHRIATKLIPYILDLPASSLPGFYPAVVAVILPFNAQQQPVEYFDPPQIEFSEDPQYGSKFRMVTHGRAYRIQYLVDQNNELAPIPLAVIRWNPDAAKMVIMDGQHRAMSLIAIERTINNSWNSAPKGARYQPFYEKHIQDHLRKAEDEGRTLDLSHVELPVTICWFPEEQGQIPRPRPHLAARKLFVDVNNTAKAPSEARLVLLSDTELQNIFARDLLNRLRSDKKWETLFPLYGVEYDNPNEAMTWPRRWSVLTNLEILKNAVIRAVFGPPKIYDSMSASLQGKPSIRDMDNMMREQLQLDDIFPKNFDDGPRPMERAKIGNEFFPINDEELHRQLLDQFYDLWGSGILTLFSKVKPYHAHLQALQDRYLSWTAADNIQTLAKDALFEGVGMFWTLQDGHNLWEEQCKDVTHANLKPEQPDVSKAWQVLNGDQQNQFCERRSMLYLGKNDEESKAICDSLFKGLRTYAAQIGLIMAWVTLHRKAAPNMRPLDLAEKLTKAINATLESGPNNQRNRTLILLKKASQDGFKPINTMPRLDPTFATHFRYLWLEIALADPGTQELDDVNLDLDEARSILIEARKFYLEMLIQDRAKLRSRDSDLREKSASEQKRLANERAKSEIIREQSDAHKYWFGGDIDTKRTMVSEALGYKPKNEPQENLDSDESEDSESLSDSEETQI